MPARLVMRKSAGTQLDQDGGTVVRPVSSLARTITRRYFVVSSDCFANPAFGKRSLLTAGEARSGPLLIPQGGALPRTLTLALAVVRAATRPLHLLLFKWAGVDLALLITVSSLSHTTLPIQCVARARENHDSKWQGLHFRL